MGNGAHSDEASLHPKCEHFAPAQRDEMEADGMQLCTSPGGLTPGKWSEFCRRGQRRDGGFAMPFATFLDTKNPAANRDVLSKLPALIVRYGSLSRVQISYSLVSFRLQSQQHSIVNPTAIIHGCRRFVDSFHCRCQRILSSSKGQR